MDGMLDQENDTIFVYHNPSKEDAIKIRKHHVTAKQLAIMFNVSYLPKCFHFLLDNVFVGRNLYSFFGQGWLRNDRMARWRWTIRFLVSILPLIHACRRACTKSFKLMHQSFEIPAPPTSSIPENKTGKSPHFHWFKVLLYQGNTHGFIASLCGAGLWRGICHKQYMKVTWSISQFNTQVFICKFSHPLISLSCMAFAGL